MEAGPSSTCSIGSGDTLQESRGHPAHILTSQGRKTLILVTKGRRGRQWEPVYNCQLNLHVASLLVSVYVTRA